VPLTEEKARMSNLSPPFEGKLNCSRLLIICGYFDITMNKGPITTFFAQTVVLGPIKIACFLMLKNTLFNEMGRLSEG